MDARSRLDSASLYAITPDAEPARTVALVAAYLRGGADVVQLRNKTLSRGLLLDLACELRGLTRPAGALLIVNDHVDIAILSQADGVHLGPDDLSLAAARRVAGPALVIGASASTLEAARAAEASGADYLGSGPAFETPVKPEKAVIGPQGVAAIMSAAGIPVFAIGGVDTGNLDRLLAAGVRRACVIRALAEATDPEAAARDLKARLAG